jgi:hypothetical protein
MELNRPPPGAWSKNASMGGTVIGATHRSLGKAVGALGICLFWNGIVSVFVLIAIASTIQHLRGSVPDWFPAPKFDNKPMSTGMTIFFWIFLTPFIVIGLGMVCAFFSYLFGRTEVWLRKEQGTIFTGVGALGYRRRFDMRQVKQVSIKEYVSRNNDGEANRKDMIVLETREGRLFKFGSMLREDRRNYVAAALRKAIFPAGGLK